MVEGFEEEIKVIRFMRVFGKDKRYLLYFQAAAGEDNPAAMKEPVFA